MRLSPDERADKQRTAYKKYTHRSHSLHHRDWERLFEFPVVACLAQLMRHSYTLWLQTILLQVSYKRISNQITVTRSHYKISEQ